MARHSPSPPARSWGGDADISAVASLFADPTGARVLMALADGRSLPASVLAREAGVTPQAASAQLNRLSRRRGDRAVTLTDLGRVRLNDTLGLAATGSPSPETIPLRTQHC